MTQPDSWPIASRSSPAGAARSAARSRGASHRKEPKVAIADLDPSEVAGGGARHRRRAAAQRHALKVDVADEASAKAAVAGTIAAFRKLTTLVNVAAAVTPDGTVESLTLAQWNQAIAVNLTGAFLMCKYAVPAAAARRRRQHHQHRLPARTPRRAAALALLHHEGGA